MTAGNTYEISGKARVAYQVIIDNEPIASPIESISVYLAVNDIPGAKIILTDGDIKIPDFELSSRPQFYPGKRIEIKVGYKLADTLVFKGIIIRHSIRNRSYNNKALSGSNLILDCKHDLIKGNLSITNNVYHSISDSSLISQLLKKYSSPVAVESTDFNFPELVQYQQSDWTFVKQRAAANGFMIMPDSENIFVRKPDINQDPALALRYGEAIWDLDAELDAQHQVNGVTFSSWDPLNQELVTVNDDVPSGAKKITEATGFNQDYIFHSGNIPEQQMKIAANSQKTARNLSQKRGRVRCNGIGKINLGDVIMLNGTGSTFQGKVLVTGIRHSVISGAWYTDIQFGIDDEEYRTLSNSASQSKNPKGLLIGTVLQIDNDPQSNERVLISIPMLNDREGIWARVAVPDAGANRGWTFWPEVNDEVIVGFLESDPNCPVVLGKFFSAKNPAPYVPDSKNGVKGIKTKSGLEIYFDDMEKSISLKTPKGNMITMNESEEGLQLLDQNKNKILLNQQGIELTSGKDMVINTKGEKTLSAKKIEMKASTEISVNGKTGLTLSSDVMSKLTGNIVKIN